MMLGLLEDIKSPLVGTLHTKSYGTSHDKYEVFVANGELFPWCQNYIVAPPGVKMILWPPLVGICPTRGRGSGLYP